MTGEWRLRFLRHRISGAATKLAALRIERAALPSISRQVTASLTLATISARLGARWSQHFSGL
jgi:hypothetical protein